MILKSIELDNFRQFYGKQRIEFSNDEKNITIILGENGKGKTGIFRALIFCLFGEKYLSIDTQNDKINLVNFNILDEQGFGKASVKTVFEDNGIVYKIKREIKGIKRNSKKQEIDGEVILEKERDNKVEKIEDIEQIENEINNVLSKDIKDFFLFDGEKIEELAKTTSEVKEEIQNGITKLLKIQDLERAIRILDSLEKEKNKDIKRSEANSEYIYLNKEKEKKEEEIINKKQEIKNYKEERISLEEEINSSKAKIEKNSDSKQLLEKLESKKENYHDKREIFKGYKEQLREKVLKNYSIVLCNTEIESVLKKINIDSNDDNIADISVLEKILLRGKCLCGNHILTGSEEEKEIKKLIKKFKKSDLKPIVNILEDTFRENFKLKENLETTLQEKKQNIYNLNEIISKIEKEIEIIKEEISNNDGIDFKSEEKRYLILKNDREDINKRLIQLENLINNNENEKKLIEKKLIEELNKDKYRKLEYLKLKKIKDIKLKFQELLEKYVSQMREKLTKETTLMFKNLIDKKDIDIIKRIQIDSEYNLNCLGWNDEKINQDISQGQKQILILSFIASLAKMASGGKSRYPLFMDTPFGRISGNNRDNLIVKLPKLTSQLVLLLTDTEFTVTEEELMKNSNRLGEAYFLKQLSPGKTVIEKKEISERISERGGII